MEIEIMVFKDTGKYYASSIVEYRRDIPLWSDEFKHFVAVNLPASCKDGYIVVRDGPNADYRGQSFHIVLFKCGDIIRI